MHKDHWTFWLMDSQLHGALNPMDDVIWRGSVGTDCLGFFFHLKDDIPAIAAFDDVPAVSYYTLNPLVNDTRTRACAITNMRATHSESSSTMGPDLWFHQKTSPPSGIEFGTSVLSALLCDDINKSGYEMFLRGWSWWNQRWNRRWSTVCDYSVKSASWTFATLHSFTYHLSRQSPVRM